MFETDSGANKNQKKVYIMKLIKFMKTNSAVTFIMAQINMYIAMNDLVEHATIASVCYTIIAIMLAYVSGYFTIKQMEKTFNEE